MRFLSPTVPLCGPAHCTCDSLTAICFCTEPSSCIMLCSVHVRALAKAMAGRRAPHGVVSMRAYPGLAFVAPESAADCRPLALG
jgi:hypothetical protein